MVIDSIKFNSDYLCFEGWEEIEFRNWMNDLLKFYLKTNDSKIPIIENIKINLILWNNWSGKTTIIYSIIRIIENKEKI